MKKIFLTGAGIIVSLFSFAQTDSSSAKNHSASTMNHQTQSSRDGVMMQNGKMMTVKGNSKTDLSSDYTCSNGTKVSTSGNVTKTDGSTMMLKDGQYVDSNGNISSVSTTMKSDKNKTNTKKMYLVSDSTAKKMSK